MPRIAKQHPSALEEIYNVEKNMRLFEEANARLG